MRLAVLDLVDPERKIERRHQVELHAIPLRPDPIEQRLVERDAAALLLRDGPHEVGAGQCVRQRADGRNDVRNQARQGVNVILAIIENRCALLGGERWALQDPLTHIAFVGGVDAIFAEVLQGSGESEKALVAVRTLRGAVVHAVAKLNVGIERARRLPPAERRCGSRTRR